MSSYYCYYYHYYYYCYYKHTPGTPLSVWENEAEAAAASELLEAATATADHW
jgi:hypothetical protein